MEINVIQFIGDVDTHYTNASSYVIIPKPHFFQAVKVYILVVAVLAQSFTAMIAVVAHVGAGDRSIDRDRRVLNSQTRGLRGRFWVFFTYKKIAGPN